MPARKLNLEHARRLLGEVCGFLKEDSSEIADFIIPANEALFLTSYTSAFIPVNDKYALRFTGEPPSFFELISLKWERGFYRNIISLWNARIEASFIGTDSFVKLLDYFRESLDKDKHLILIDTEPYYDERFGVFYERIIEDVFDKIKSSKLSPSNFVIWMGLNGEDFWIYLSAVLFRKMGYIAGYYNLGAGDVSAYYISEYIKKLKNKKLISCGAFLEELGMLPQKSFLKCKEADKVEDELVLIEAESTDKSTIYSGVSQVIEFMHRAPMYYTHAYVAGPYAKPEKISEDWIGLISCDENGRLIFKEAKRFRETKKEAIDLVKIIMKSYLLRNFTLEEKLHLIGERIRSLEEYIGKLIDLDIETILEELRI